MGDLIKFSDVVLYVTTVDHWTNTIRRPCPENRIFLLLLIHGKWTKTSTCPPVGFKLLDCEGNAQITLLPLEKQI